MSSSESISEFLLSQSKGDDDMLSHIGQTAPTLLHRLQSGISNLRFELVWATHARWPLLPGRERNLVRISVLDSSFNPPTLAHLALANSKRPSYSREPLSTDYDAKLLLLSVKNADKTLKPGDASYLQRLQMMGLLAQDVSTQHMLENGLPNVAIGIVDEPTFVGKSKILKEYFRSKFALDPPSPQTQLTFIVGMDTLERLFSAKYYPAPPDRPDLTNDQVMWTALDQMLSPEGGNSLLVCAKRSTLASDVSQHGKGESGLDETLTIASRMGWLKSDGDGAFVERQDGAGFMSKDERIVLIDIGDRESRFSSTAVRNARGRIGTLGSEIGGGPWRDWVTSRVATYLQNENLYLG